MKKTVAVALVFVMMLALCSCAVMPEKTIIGSWRCNTTILGVVTETVYTFYEDGTGVRTNAVNVDFTYSFGENDSLTITASAFGFENTEEYTFKFDGTKKLVLTGEDNKILTLEKIK